MALLAGKALAREIARLASDKKASDLLILDLRKFNAPAEFYVLGTALSAPHLQGLRDHIVQELKPKGLRALHSDGLGEGSEWLVIDYFDVMVHLFSEPKRRLFDLEDLFSDAPREAFGPDGATPLPTPIKPKKKVMAPAPRRKPAPRKKRS